MKVKRIVTLLAAVLLLGGGAFAAPRAVVSFSYS